MRERYEPWALVTGGVGRIGLVKAAAVSMFSCLIVVVACAWPALAPAEEVNYDEFGRRPPREGSAGELSIPDPVLDPSWPMPPLGGGNETEAESAREGEEVGGKAEEPTEKQLANDIRPEFAKDHWDEDEESYPFDDGLEPEDYRAPAE